jgi:hypothetical protein
VAGSYLAEPHAREIWKGTKRLSQTKQCTMHRNEGHNSLMHEKGFWRLSHLVSRCSESLSVRIDASFVHLEPIPSSQV